MGQDGRIEKFEKSRIITKSRNKDRVKRENLEHQKMSVIRENLKVVILGNSGYVFILHHLLIRYDKSLENSTGKTSLVSRYCDGDFVPSKGKNGLTKSDYHREVTLPKQNKVVAMEISDTQVEVKTQSINEKFFAGVHACVLVYDVTDRQSFEGLEDWYEEFHTKARPTNFDSFPFIVIGNKTDVGKQEVSQDEAQDWCRSMTKKIPIQHFEVSAKSNINVDKAFDSLAKLYLKSKPAEEDAFSDSTTIDTRKGESTSSGGCTCVVS